MIKEKDYEVDEEIIFVAIGKKDAILRPARKCEKYQGGRAIA